MQLPIRMPGLGHVNMYCFVDDRGAAVLDPGLPGEPNWEAIQDRLRKADLDVRHIHTVVITHSHVDHFGGAARFRAETGCRVIAHEAFTLFGGKPYQPHLEVSVEHLETMGPTPVPEGAGPEIVPWWMRGEGPRPLAPWGGARPAPDAEQRRQWEAGLDVTKLIPRLTHTVRHGSSIRLAGRDFFVWHTPGHTADHLCMVDPEEGLFFAGDHVLPSITPHISGLGETPDPLQAYCDSLDRVLEVGPVALCLPAHGHPFADLPGRVHAIKRHHTERLEKLKAISKRLGTATVEQLSQELFHPRNWGPGAESETYAHLEHLRLRAELERRRREDGFFVYTA